MTQKTFVNVRDNICINNLDRPLFGEKIVGASFGRCFAIGAEVLSKRIDDQVPHTLTYDRPNLGRSFEGGRCEVGVSRVTHPQRLAL